MIKNYQNFLNDLSINQNIKSLNEKNKIYDIDIFNEEDWNETEPDRGIKISIKMSDSLIDILESINNNYSKLLLDLNNGEIGVKNIYANYLDFDGNGNITFLYNDKTINDQRSKIKITKILTKILSNKEEIYEEYDITPKVIESFINEWNMKFNKQIYENKSNKKHKIKMAYGLIDILNSIDNNYSKLLLDLRLGIIEIKNIYANYLDFDGNGNITYLYNDKAIQYDDNYNSDQRSLIKITKILNKILLNKEEIYNKYKITQQVIEFFINEWSSIFDKSIKIEEWSGHKILDAFNYSDNIDTTKFGTSCANFNDPDNGFQEPKEEWYKVYIENPNNIKCIVSLKGNTLTGRRLIIEGEQQFDYGILKKGKKYTIINGYYGEDGTNSIFDKKILQYIKDNKSNPCLNTSSLLNIKTKKRVDKDERIIVKLDKTDFPQYPPFDNVYINNENKLLASNKPYVTDLSWTYAYKAGVDYPRV
jgi:hypothetical protein